MSWLKEICERLFHWSNITYIANSYGEDIWISIKSNDLELHVASIGLDAMESQVTRLCDLKLIKTSEIGWIKLTSGNIHKHNRSSKTERITIVCTDTLKKALAAVAAVSNNVSDAVTGDVDLVLVLNYQIQQNYSYIVTSNGEFLQQKYGSNNLFLDFLNKDHNPEETNSNTAGTEQNEEQTNLNISDTSPNCSVFLSTLFYFSVFICTPLCITILPSHIKGASTSI
ncbi:unnamed protein product [Adineta ricciae]|uniref:Uncharacterized protein n=1 Tax=Adineta ricciae TaxID=249248 RepID=A0A814T3Y0_ADIRI|nr:unnamed protein product [Adineta ricciae]